MLPCPALLWSLEPDRGHHITDMTPLPEIDPVLADLIGREADRQRNHIHLIASENTADYAMLQAVGSVLTNKYSEGYPGRRYYEGCEMIDAVENLAIERAKALFGAEHANVQAHSGSQANMAAYLAVLEPGDTILGMRLDQGGHLTHGSPVSFSGDLFNIVAYGVDPETERIDMDELRRLAIEHKPKMIIAGYSAYSQIPDWAGFRAVADEVGAVLLVDMAHITGLVAGRVHPSPVPFADIVTATTHKSLRGPRGGLILSTDEYAKAINKSVFPYAQGGPFNHQIAGKALAFKKASEPAFAEYATQIVRNAKVLAAINDLGPGHERERPTEEDAGFASRVRDWQQRHGVAEPYAVLGCVLSELEEPGEDTEKLLSGVGFGGRPKDVWLREVAKWIFGTGCCEGN